MLAVTDLIHLGGFLSITQGESVAVAVPLVQCTCVCSCLLNKAVGFSALLSI